MSQYFLCVAAIFKNEADILEEWIEHYLEEGVEHFYLIENNSTDQWAKVLYPYRVRGLVTVFQETGEQVQIRAYNQYIRPLQTTEWMIVVDLDEFVYARVGTISGFLRALPPEVGNVKLPWIQFGSSGYERQPKGVIQNFVYRKSYVLGCPELNKTIVRLRDLEEMAIHDHKIKPGVISVTGAGEIAPMFWGTHVLEDRVKSDFLILNHYQIMSRERYLRVKAGRGDAVFKNNLRGESCFNADASNFGRIRDDALARKRRKSREAAA